MDFFPCEPVENKYKVTACSLQLLKYFMSCFHCNVKAMTVMFSKKKGVIWFCPPFSKQGLIRMQKQRDDTECLSLPFD